MHNIAMSSSYVLSKCLQHDANISRVSCFEFFILAQMSHLTFADVFTVMKDEYGTHSKENEEEVLNAIRELLY